MANMNEFTKWLNAKLRELNTDEAVFGSYIIGILDGDDTVEEKTEALEGILSEILTDNLNELVSSIMQKWHEYHAPQTESTQRNGAQALDVEDRLAKLLEASALNATTVKERAYTEEERKIREQILAQYSQSAVSDDEYNNDSEEEIEQKAAGSSSLSGIEKNTNVQDVMQLQKERREQARMDSAAKKQKDKEDRAKQKQLREEKKEKRKTVKGERRR